MSAQNLQRILKPDNMQMIHVILSQRDGKAPSGQRVTMNTRNNYTEVSDLSKYQCANANVH